MTLLKLILFSLGIAAATPALAEDIVILRGSSAPPTPWYEPPPEPRVTVQTVYVPSYYLPSVRLPAHGRPHQTVSARRNR